MMWRVAAFVLAFAFGVTPAAAITLDEAALGNVFVVGERVAVPVRAEGDSVHWAVHDFFGAERASGDVALAGGAAVLQPNIESLGYFTLDVSAKRGGSTLDTVETTFAVLPVPKPGRAESPFGVMTHFAKGWSTDVIPLIEKAGIRHARDEQPWKQVEKRRGQYAFPPRLTDYVAALSAHHIDPLIVLAFANPLYDDGKTPFSAEGRAAYAAYVHAVVEHYASTIAAVEIWNEYSGSFCDGPCRGDRSGYYSSMLRDAYQAAKAADPAIKVLGGAAVPIPLEYFRGLFKDGALTAMDAAVIHPYRKQPEGVEDKVDELRELMIQYGGTKPIWATEFSDIPDMHKSRDDVARYLVRMSTLLLSAKLERIYWYLFEDYQEFTGLGLVHGEKDSLGRYTPTPAYVAEAVLIHELDGMSFVRREATAPENRVYLFTDGTAEVRVAWSALPAASYQLASDQPVKVVTIMGDEKIISPRNGQIEIALDGDPLYIVGQAGR